MCKLKIGLVGAMQYNFLGCKEQLFDNSVKELKCLSEKLGFDFYYYPDFVITGDDARKAKKAVEAEGVDFLLIQNTTFAAGDVIITLAKTNAYIGLWGLPENPGKSVFIDSVNSFCGINMYSSIVANYLKDYSIKYKWFYGYADQELFIKRFEVSARALAAIKKMKNSRVALIGGIAPAFNDLYFDERLGQKRLGIEIERNHEFSEIKDRAYSYKESELEAAFGTITCGYKCIKDASKESLEKNARFYKAYIDFCSEYRYDALGISCWPKMQTEAHGMSCSIIGKLNQNGIPAACEGDLPGAVSMLMLKYITEQPATLMDLSGFDEDDETVFMWHCGPSPECYANDNGVKLTYSNQPTATKDFNRVGLLHDMVFKPQAVTFMRFAGEWDGMFLADGNIINTPKNSFEGSRGWVGGLRLNRENISVRDFINTILVQGFQHHYPMMSGDITKELMEIAAWLDLKHVEAVGYQDFLQNKK